MANCPIIGVGGVQKEYVFKDGLWNPEFTVTGNTFTINASGMLNKNGSAYIYVQNKNVFVKYLATNVKYSNGGVGGYDINYYSSMYNGETVLSSFYNGNISIRTTLHASSGDLVIKEIWVE